MAAAAGAIGGLAGTLAMNYAQRLWTLAVDGHPPESAAGAHDARDWQERGEHQNSNELAAQHLAVAILHRRLTDRELAVAAPLVHFSFGATVAAFYGAWAATHPDTTRSGALFGAVLWLTADEIAMPLMGLSGRTDERRWPLHLQSFAAHVVYGVTAEQVRQAIVSRRSLERPPLAA